MPSIDEVAARRARATARTFVMLVLALSLGYWAICWAAQHGRLPFTMDRSGFLGFFPGSLPGFLAWALLANFGPTVAALIALAAHEGTAGLKELGRSLVRWRVPGRMWALAFLGPFVLNGIVLIVSASTSGVGVAPDRLAPARLVLMFLLMVPFDGPLGEEIGWRGVLLPRLLAVRGPVSASILVGVVWYLWHLPLYLANGRDMDAVFFVFYFIDVTAYAIVFTWFFVNGRCSTLLMVFLHATTNFLIFLRVRGFPARGNAPLARVVAEFLVVAAAVVCAVALARRRPATIESS